MPEYPSLADRAFDLPDAAALPTGFGRDPENITVAEAQKTARLGRTILYKAMHPDPAYRGGLPHLRSLRIGRARRIRLSTLQAWLAELERSTSQQPAA